MCRPHLYSASAPVRHDSSWGPNHRGRRLWLCTQCHETHGGLCIRSNQPLFDGVLLLTHSQTRPPHHPHAAPPAASYILEVGVGFVRVAFDRAPLWRPSSCSPGAPAPSRSKRRVVRPRHPRRIERALRHHPPRRRRRSSTARARHHWDRHAAPRRQTRGSPAAVRRPRASRRRSRWMARRTIRRSTQSEMRRRCVRSAWAERWAELASSILQC